MTIRQIVDTFNKISELDDPTSLVDNKEMMEILSNQRYEYERYCKIAQNILLEKISEKNLVRFILMVQKSVAAMSTVAGNQALLMAEIEGSLQSYTQTVVLATIGALIEDEIL